MWRQRQHCGSIESDNGGSSSKLEGVGGGSSDRKTQSCTPGLPASQSMLKGNPECSSSAICGFSMQGGCRALYKYCNSKDCAGDEG